VDEVDEFCWVFSGRVIKNVRPMVESRVFKISLNNKIIFICFFLLVKNHNQLKKIALNKIKKELKQKFIFY
jgi:hypothetical protein